MFLHVMYNIMVWHQEDLLQRIIFHHHQLQMQKYLQINQDNVPDILYKQPKQLRYHSLFEMCNLTQSNDFWFQSYYKSHRYMSCDKYAHDAYIKEVVAHSLNQ